MDESVEEKDKEEKEEEKGGVMQTWSRNRMKNNVEKTKDEGKKEGMKAFIMKKNMGDSIEEQKKE